MDLKKRRQNQDAAAKPLTITFPEGDTLNIRYRPQSLTAGEAREFAKLAKKLGNFTQEDADSNDTVDALSLVANSQEMMLLRRVAWWDLTNGGVTVPLTSDGLTEHEVDIPLIQFILDAIKADESPKPLTVPTSANG